MRNQNERILGDTEIELNHMSTKLTEFQTDPLERKDIQEEGEGEEELKI